MIRAYFYMLISQIQLGSGRKTRSHIFLASKVVLWPKLVQLESNRPFGWLCVNLGKEHLAGSHLCLVVLTATPSSLCSKHPHMCPHTCEGDWELRAEKDVWSKVISIVTRLGDGVSLWHFHTCTKYILILSLTQPLLLTWARGLVTQQADAPRTYHT